jgi:hypothetical protein
MLSPLFGIHDIDQVAHIPREGHLPLHHLTGARMRQSQLSGVQGLPVKTTQGIDQDLRGLSRAPKTPPVYRITDHRMSNMGHMDPDLMGSASL